MRVTVGQYAGMPLQDSPDTLRHGGIFVLRNPPINDAVAVSPDGWTTLVKKGVKAVVTFGPAAATDATATYRVAIKAANDGLDYLSVRGEADVMIQNDGNHFIVWWPESTGVIMQTTAIESSRLALFATVQVRSADGTVRPSPPLTPIQHDAFRYVRMSRTSAYLYDSYRNIFLALECLLNAIAPQPARGEGEGTWFKRALGEADKFVPVTELAPANEPDPIQWIYDNVYGDERSALSHAKRDYLLPQDEAERDGLIESLEKLSNYVHRLIEAYLGVQHPRSNLSAPFRSQLLRNMLMQWKLYVSDDMSPFNDDDPDTSTAPGQQQSSPGNSAGAAWRKLKSCLLQRFSLPGAEGPVVVEAAAGGFVMVDQYLGMVSASWDASALSTIRAICRIGACQADGGPAGLISDLRGPLELGNSVTRYELRVGLRILDAHAPPRNFVA